MTWTKINERYVRRAFSAWVAGRIEEEEAIFAVAFSGVLARGRNHASPGPWRHLAPQIRPTIALDGGQVYIIGQLGGR